MASDDEKPPKRQRRKLHISPSERQRWRSVLRKAPVTPKHPLEGLIAITITREPDDETLFQFFGCTFNEDCGLDFKTWQDAVRDYALRCPRKHLERLVALLTRLLAETTTDRQIEDKVNTDYAANYAPSNVGESARKWVAEIISELEDAIRSGHHKVAPED